VHKAAGMDRGQSLGQPRAECEYPFRGQWPAPVDVVLQQRPVDVGGGHPRRVGLRIRVDHRGSVEAAYPFPWDTRSQCDAASSQVWDLTQPGRVAGPRAG